MEEFCRLFDIIMMVEGHCVRYEYNLGCVFPHPESNTFRETASVSFFSIPPPKFPLIREKKGLVFFWGPNNHPRVVHVLH